MNEKSAGMSLALPNLVILLLVGFAFYKSGDILSSTHPSTLNLNSPRLSQSKVESWIWEAPLTAP